jgi:hypothetical protein
MLKKNYLLTVKIPLECLDDLDARDQYFRQLVQLQQSIKLDKCIFNLQEIHKDSPPRKVNI